MKTLGELEKNSKELIEKSEIVKEYTERNMRIMKAPDGREFVTPIEWTPKPSLYGEFLMTEGEANEEEIEMAKEQILDKICESIRYIAKRKPNEFFIIKTPSSMAHENSWGNVTSVGAKFILPTVLDDEEANGRG